MRTDPAVLISAPVLEPGPVGPSLRRLVGRRAAILAALGGGLVHLFARLSRKLLEPDGCVTSDRVAVVCDSFIRYGTAQAIGLKRAGADVVFYYVDRLGEFGGDWDEREAYLAAVRDAGISTVPLPERDMRRLPHQIRHLHEDLVARRIGLIFLQAHIDPRYVSLPWRFRVATIIHDPRPHSGDYESAYPLLVRAVARVAEASSAAIFVHSERLRSELYPMFRKVPLGVFPHGTNVAPQPIEVPAEPKMILVGRLMEYKGVDVALDAFEAVRRVRPDTTLVLAGRGRMGPQIRARGLAGVELLDGYLPDAELDALFASARLCLLPYRDGTQSGVGLVAAGLGVPCVVSNVGGLPDLMPDPTYVSPAGESKALAETILRVLDHGNETRLEVWNHARTHFDWPAVGARMLTEATRMALIDRASNDS